MSSSGAIRDAVFSIHASTGHDDDTHTHNTHPRTRRSAAMIGGRMVFMIATEGRHEQRAPEPGNRRRPAAQPLRRALRRPETSHATASLTLSQSWALGLPLRPRSVPGSAIIRARAAPRAREALPGQRASAMYGIGTARCRACPRARRPEIRTIRAPQSDGEQSARRRDPPHRGHPHVHEDELAAGACA